jgi:hypothetical protein
MRKKWRVCSMFKKSVRVFVEKIQVLQKELYNLLIHIYVSCKALFEAPCIKKWGVLRVAVCPSYI